MATKDDRVTKRKVTMRSVMLAADGSTLEHKVEDYVRPDHLDAYVEDARTKWQSVTVSDDPDAGPGGYDGPTAVPSHLNLPDAGVLYEGTDGWEDNVDLSKAAPADATKEA